MNIISCRGIFKSSISTVIFTCINDLVPYYLSKVFVINETEVGGFDDIKITVKKINATRLHKEESLLICKAATS